MWIYNKYSSVSKPKLYWLTSCFEIKSAVKFLSATSLQPETIVSMLSKKWEADFHTIEIVMTKLALIGRLLSLLGMGISPCGIRNPLGEGWYISIHTISTKTFRVLDKEVQGLLNKGKIYKVRPILGQYFSSYSSVPKSKWASDKWRLILNI